MEIVLLDPMNDDQIIQGRVYNTSRLVSPRLVVFAKLYSFLSFLVANIGDIVV